MNKQELLKRNLLTIPTEKLEALLRRAKTNAVPGALANGSRVEKIEWEPGEYHLPGATGKLIGCLGKTDGGVYGYFLNWDEQPGLLAFTTSSKIRPLSSAT